MPVRLSSPGYHKRRDRAVSPLPRKTHAPFVSAATPSHLCLHRNHLSVRNNVGSRPVPLSLRLDSCRHDIASRRILRWTGRHPDSDPGSTPQFVPRRRPSHHRPNRPILFVLNPTSDTISVLAIDQNTGALTEAPGSPVPAPVPSPGGGSAPVGPLCMATFKGASANYLYVAYRNGPMEFTGAIVAFRIGTASQPLTPVVTIPLEATPVDIVVSP